MNIALILQHKLALGIQQFLFGTPMPVSAPVAAAPTRMRSRAEPVGEARISKPRVDTHLAKSGKVASAKVMPLRVLRVVDADQPRSCTGRLVISGRMADVCAELDRLAEREAALH